MGQFGERRNLVGQFAVSLILHGSPGRADQRLEVLVDSGAVYSVVPRGVLASLGCRLVRGQRVVLADGRVEEWPLGEIEVECEGRRAITPVLMGPEEGPPLLGATTLEVLGLGIDPLNRRLVPMDVYLV